MSSKKELEKGLSAEELDELEMILEDFPSAQAFNLEVLDGFFAGLLCGPSIDTPLEYLHLICGTEPSEEGLPFDTKEGLDRFITLILRHWNRIAESLEYGDSEEDAYVPSLLIDEEDPEFEGNKVPRGNEWAEGFLLAIDTCRGSWKRLLHSEEEEHEAYLTPIFVLGYEHDSNPELRSPPLTEEMRRRVLTSLPLITYKIYDFFRPERKALSEQLDAPIRRAEPKIGRNDPCPCGSGKKYKRCCGNVVTH